MLRDDEEDERVASTPDDVSDPMAPTGRVDLNDRVERDSLRAEVRARMFGAAAPAVMIGRYAILKKLGEGGMGTVYAAYDDQLDRRVALKLLKTAQAVDARLRMLREAQALAKLSHPNVVPVFEVGEHEGQLFVAMEYVRGVTLRRWRDDGEHGWREVLAKYVQAGRGLAAAHAAGLVHRDFKPHNAVVGHDGRVRVLDFGLAAKQGAVGAIANESVMLLSPHRGALDSPLTESGTVMGTPAYMPPEQFMGGDVDPRGDQFSFCVALWEALYGTRPFGGDNATELFTRVAQGKFIEPGATQVPTPLRALLVRGLRPAVTDRWPDMPTLLFEFEQWEHQARSKRRIIAVLVAGVACVGALAWWQIDRSRTITACDRAGGAIDAIWNDDARAAVRSALLATGVSYATSTAERVQLRLDAYAGAWRSARTDACLDNELRGLWTADLEERAAWCLEERALELDAHVDGLSQLRAGMLADAISATALLSEIDACRDVSYLSRLAAPPSRDRERIRAVRTDLARIRLEDDDQARLALAKAAKAEAEAIDWPPLLAAAERRLGTELSWAGEMDAAESAFADAYFHAANAGALDEAWRASEFLAEFIGNERGRPSEGLHWSRLAEVALAGLRGQDASLHAATHDETLARLHSSTGRYAEAKAAIERALAIQQRLLGDEHPIVGTTVMKLGLIYRGLGDVDGARRVLEQALAIFDGAFGSDHPLVANVLINLGGADLNTDREASARPRFERAKEILEEAFGPDSPMLSKPLEGLGVLLFNAGEYAEAKRLQQRSLALRESEYGPDHPEIAMVLIRLGDIELELGAYEPATAIYTRAARIQKQGAEPRHRARVSIGLAKVALAQSRPNDALALAEEAVTLREIGDPPGLLAEARFVLARVLWDADPAAGRDRARALALATSARDGFVEGGQRWGTNTETVTAWLRDHVDVR